jgi:hypothetical protein
MGYAAGKLGPEIYLSAGSNATVRAVGANPSQFVAFEVQIASQIRGENPTDIYEALFGLESVQSRLADSAYSFVADGGLEYVLTVRNYGGIDGAFQLHSLVVDLA